MKSLLLVNTFPLICFNYELISAFLAVRPVGNIGEKKYIKFINLLSQCCVSRDENYCRQVMRRLNSKSKVQISHCEIAKITFWIELEHNLAILLREECLTQLLLDLRSKKDFMII